MIIPASAILRASQIDSRAFGSGSHWRIRCKLGSRPRTAIGVHAPARMPVAPLTPYGLPSWNFRMLTLDLGLKAQVRPEQQFRRSLKTPRS
jgi:hypothetical protein